MQEYCPWCMCKLELGQVCSRCGKKPEQYVPSGHHLPPDTVLKKQYILGRVLGEGGFGITYLGFDTNLERPVAVKEYFPTVFVQREFSVNPAVTCYTDERKTVYEQGRDRFLEEARMIARLGDIPEIVHALDFFQENNTAYIVMEFLEGSTLQQITTRGRISPPTLFGLMEPLLRAMDMMHRAGLIHRDISPDNLMQLENGRIKLLDFGCARDLGSDRTMTVTLKHGYAPLEQYTGHNQGPWTDIYALCATIYYCLTRRRPPRAIARNASEPEELIPPTKLGAAISPQQEQALLKGLAIEPQDRWQSVEDLYAALYHTTMDRPSVPLVVEEEPVTVPIPHPDVIPRTKATEAETDSASTQKTDQFIETKLTEPVPGQKSHASRHINKAALAVCSLIVLLSLALVGVFLLKSGRANPVDKTTHDFNAAVSNPDTTPSEKDASKGGAADPVHETTPDFHTAVSNPDIAPSEKDAAKDGAVDPEPETTPDSEAASSGKYAFGGHQYYIFDLAEISTWEEAEQFCRSSNGHLATITSEEENNFVYSLLERASIHTAYFGLSDTEQEGVWAWCTGEDVVYTNWASGEPNNWNECEHYALFYRNNDARYTGGQWNDGDFPDQSAGGGKAFICEWD